MLVKDKLLLENLTRKYGKYFIINEMESKDSIGKLKLGKILYSYFNKKENKLYETIGELKYNNKLIGIYCEIQLDTRGYLELQVLDEYFDILYNRKRSEKEDECGLIFDKFTKQLIKQTKNVSISNLDDIRVRTLSDFVEDCTCGAIPFEGSGTIKDVEEWIAFLKEYNKIIKKISNSKYDLFSKEDLSVDSWKWWDWLIHSNRLTDEEKKYYSFGRKTIKSNIDDKKIENEYRDKTFIKKDFFKYSGKGEKKSLNRWIPSDDTSYGNYDKWFEELDIEMLEMITGFDYVDYEDENLTEEDFYEDCLEWWDNLNDRKKERIYNKFNNILKKNDNSSNSSSNKFNYNYTTLSNGLKYRTVGDRTYTYLGSEKDLSKWNASRTSIARKMYDDTETSPKQYPCEIVTTSSYIYRAGREERVVYYYYRYE
jgi:hypothetical protein